MLHAGLDLSRRRLDVCLLSDQSATSNGIRMTYTQSTMNRGRIIMPSPCYLTERERSLGSQGLLAQLDRSGARE
jgi:hypothetical protein